jgi:hypothetical protein
VGRGATTTSNSGGDISINDQRRQLHIRLEKQRTRLLNRHRMEADTLCAMQRDAWEKELKRCGQLDFASRWQHNTSHVPTVGVVCSFEILPT